MSSTPTSSSSNNEVISVILDFIKSGNTQPASKPGFAHSLKLSYNTISKDRLSWSGKDTLDYTYKFPPGASKEASSTGFWLALLDELTSNACVGRGKPSPPGLSIQVQIEVVNPTFFTRRDGLEEVLIKSTVTKLGRTISFVRCEFFSSDTNELLAFGSQVKYMPTGSFIMDFVFRNTWTWRLYVSTMLSSSPPPYYEEKDFYKQVIAPHLEYQGIGSALFTVTSEHVNPFGLLHGGCHGVLMELVGETVVRDLKDAVALQSMQVDYISACRGKVKIIAAPRTPDNLLQMRVCIYDAKTDRLLSDGKLTWSSIAKETPSQKAKL